MTIRKRVKMKVSLFFAWYDCWVGFFYDQKKRTLYICPLPMVVIKIEPKAQPEPEESMAWLCQCGNWEESGLHCLSCGTEPPWGCDCSFCNDYDNSDEYDNFYDEDYEPDWTCDSCGQDSQECLCEYQEE